VHGKDIPAVVKQNNRGGGRGSSGHAQQPGEGERDQQPGEGDEALEFAEEEVSILNLNQYVFNREKSLNNSYLRDLKSFSNSISLVA
jgi:hypothetical protein